jgi:hypothetical protein
VKLYRFRRFRAAVLNSFLFVLLIITISWELRLIPLSTDWDFRNRTKALTGMEFWSSSEYRFEDIGIRGEGYTFEIYRLSDEVAAYFINPEEGFFSNYPDSRFETTRWEKTPIEDTVLINYVTPIYSSWSKSDQSQVARNQELVRKIAKENGSYFAVRRSGGTDLYLISPARKVFIYINHNM